MDVFVPFDARDPKSRLAPVLSETERLDFGIALLADVLEVLQSSPHTPRVLSTAPIEAPVPTFVDDRDLTRAVNEVLEVNDPPLAVVMADLGLVTEAAMQKLFAHEADVTLVPGVGGGTTAFLVREPGFRVDFHGCSYQDHRSIARDAELSVATVDSFRLSMDIDEPDDLVEVLVHGEGEAHRWLCDHGFELERAGKHRLAVTREGGN